MTKPLHIIERTETLMQNPCMENLYRMTMGHGDAIAAQWLENGQERSMTYSQLDQTARRYGSYLKQKLREVPQGSFVAIAMDTCVTWVPAFWGVIMSGYNALLLDANLNPDMTAYMLEQGGATAIICEKERPLPAHVIQVTKEELEASPAGNLKPVFGNMVALCTSGTTATSRIFVYNGEAVCQQVRGSELIYRNNRRIISDTPKRSLAFLPFHHVFGFMVCVLWIHFLGCVNVYLKDRTPQTIVETARRFRINLLIAVPLLANNLSINLRKKVAREGRMKRWLFWTMYSLSLTVQRVAPTLGITFAEKVLFSGILNQLLGTDVDSIILGGSHTPSEHLKMLTALGYYTVCGFGMTETAITSVETSMKLGARVSGSVGCPLPSAEYKVIPVDEKNLNRGEMAIRGKSIHVARLVDGQLAPADLDEEGWYRTGDVVRQESGGRMFVEGRIKEIIVNESGENVYPDELEDTFAQLDGVEQLCILGISRSECHEPYEDIALVMNVGDRFGDEAFLWELQAKVIERNNRQPVLKKLTRVIVTGERLPVSNGIKVKRAALKAQILDRSIPMAELSVSHVRSASTEDDAARRQVDAKELIRRKVREIYASALEIQTKDLHDDDHIMEDLGGDSLQVLSIAVKVEEQFGVMIQPEEYMSCVSVNGLTDLLYDKMNGVSRQTVAKAVTPITRFEDAPEFIAFQKRAEALLKQPEKNPYFVCHESPLRDVSMMDGKPALNFGSYNYVGMSGRPEVVAAAKAAIDKYGTSASGSRLLAGEKSLYRELEQEIADWKHTEDSLVLVGGHSTNVTFVGNFCGEGDLILHDALAHNSVDQGCRLSAATAKPFPHNDTVALETMLRTYRDKFAKVLIIIEGAYSMDGDIADVPAFVALKKKYGCFLMVDEAHSACVIGETGGGVDEYFHLQPGDVDIKMGTLSKGLGTCGGYLAGPRSIIEYLRYNLPGFVFSVGISPPLAAAALEAIRLLRTDPSIMARMKENINTFVEEAHKRNLDTCLAGGTAIIPIMVGKDEDAFALSYALRQQGVFVPPAVFPAVPKGKARLRFCVISEHHKEQIIQALDTLVETARAMNIPLPAPKERQTV